MIDYKTVLSTTSSKVTLLEYLHALSQEFGESKIVSITLSNSNNKTLTFTFVLADGTVKTTSASAITLTEDEKTLINEMAKTVSASSEGVTFNQAVTCAGNIVFKGNEIHNGYVSFLGDENHAGTATYKGVIKTSEIDNTSGNAMLRDKSTEGAIVLGSSTKKAVIMGSGDRPTYSKDGSDFTGSELALKSDVTNFSLPYYYAGKSVYDSSYHSTFVLPSIALFNTYTYLFAETTFKYYENLAMNKHPIHFASKNDIQAGSNLFYTFLGCTNECDIYLPNMDNCRCFTMFYNSKFTKVLIEDGCTVSWRGDCGATFENLPNLTEIGAIDLTNTTKPAVGLKFYGCPKLKSIHMTHFHYTFSLQYNTAFEESDIVEIFNNLDVVTTTQSVSLAAATYDLLTTADIAIATGKGWSVVRVG